MVESSLTTAFHWLKSCLKNKHKYTQISIGLTLTRPLTFGYRVYTSQCACFIDSCLRTAPDSDTKYSTLFICVHNVYSLQRSMHIGRGYPYTARFLSMASKGSIMFNFSSEINQIIKLIKMKRESPNEF